MRYVSTRGQAPVRDFAGVLLAGLAEDGGLYVPETWPSLSPEQLRAFRGMPYPQVAAHVLGLFTGGLIGADALAALCRDAYAAFPSPAVAPLVQLDAGLWAMELFHGPTLAFKDMAMQVLGRLFDHALAGDGRRATILGATSGDTGSAAIEACRGRSQLDVVILHPVGRTTEVQRRQMTTVREPNVRNIAVEGTFDDCQDLVKAAFATMPLRRDLRLTAVNSINWARVAAQIPYYVAAAVALGAPEREVAFSVPSGNFGNVLAAWAARRMGVPIARLVVGSNRNDILARFLDANDMTARPVEPSLSPSMDIQVSSNFERLLFELLDRDPAATAATMHRFRETGSMDVPDAAWQASTEPLFRGFRLDDARHRRGDRPPGFGPATSRTRTARSASPRARAHALPGVPMVVAMTAHPAKFPDAMEAATGRRPPLPPALADLYSREERFTTAPARLDAIEAELRAFSRRNAA